MKKRRVLSVINQMMPKKKLIVFNSFPDLSESPLALYLYIVNNRKDIINCYDLIWVVSEKPDHYKKRLCMLCSSYEHVVIDKKSAFGIWCFLRAKYLVTSHGYFGGLDHVANQIHLNLWHGMPLKKIGKAMNVQSATGFEVSVDVTVATSNLFRGIISSSFGIPEENVKISGLPRNDWLMKKGNGLHSLGVNHQYKKVIMWMPTYRKSIIGDLRIDGDSDGFGVQEVLFSNFNRLDRLLSDNDYLLIIKPHPMDEMSQKTLPSSKNIMPINDFILNETNTILYSLLADTDVLITDYSSVFVDYLLTGKPVAFVCGDMIKYGQTRGFYFDNIRDYLPGEILDTPEDLFAYLENIEYYNNKWGKKYEEIRGLFHEYIDDKSSLRVSNEIWPCEGLGR